MALGLLRPHRVNILRTIPLTTHFLSSRPLACALDVISREKPSALLSARSHPVHYLEAVRLTPKLIRAAFLTQSRQSLRADRPPARFGLSRPTLAEGRPHRGPCSVGARTRRDGAPIVRAIRLGDHAQSRTCCLAPIPTHAGGNEVDQGINCAISQSSLGTNRKALLAI